MVRLPFSHDTRAAPLSGIPAVPFRHLQLLSATGALLGRETAQPVPSRLENTRRHHGLRIYGYVVMPEHVHPLLSEPERSTLATAIQALKVSVAKLAHEPRADEPFWQKRYYDHNIRSYAKFVEKLRYIHRNPVKRGLVARPEDWPWSSFRHYAFGESGVIEIESERTARLRERAAISPP